MYLLFNYQSKYQKHQIFKLFYTVPIILLNKYLKTIHPRMHGIRFCARGYIHAFTKMFFSEL